MNIYNQVAEVLKDMTEKKSSFKNAIYNRLPEFEADRNFKKIYKIVIEVSKNKKLIEEIIQTFYQEISVKNQELLMVLVHEKFLSAMNKKIGGKLMRMLKDKEEEVKKFIASQRNETADEPETEISQTTKDRMYFRV